MMPLKSTPETVRTLGYLSLGLAALNTIVSHFHSSSVLLDIKNFDPGVSLANETLAFMGIALLVIAGCLKKIEREVENIARTTSDTSDHR